MTCLISLFLFIALMMVIFKWQVVVELYTKDRLTLTWCVRMRQFPCLIKICISAIKEGAAQCGDES